MAILALIFASWQIAEQLAVEVDVKNVMERGKNFKKCLY